VGESNEQKERSKDQEPTVSRVNVKLHDELLGPSRHEASVGIVGHHRRSYHPTAPEVKPNLRGQDGRPSRSP
jgi:hypothetical protein